MAKKFAVLQNQNAINRKKLLYYKTLEKQYFHVQESFLQRQF